MASAVYVFAGVSGSGKSTVARAFAEKKGIPFLDADDFHPESNVKKMAQGIALDDADRAGWLASLNEELRKRAARGEPAALACSALKERYRVVLSLGLERFYLFLLHGDTAILRQRLDDREGHFMKSDLLQSQLDDLEIPTEACMLDIAEPVDALVEQALRFACAD